MRDMSTQPEKFAAAVDRVDEALRAMWRGNSEPYAALWAPSDEVTVFGALGPAEKGWPEVSQTLRWIGGKFSGEGRSTIERLATGESGDLAYTVGFERRTARLDGGDLRRKRYASRTYTAGSTADGILSTVTPTLRNQIPARAEHFRSGAGRATGCPSWPWNTAGVQ